MFKITGRYKELIVTQGGENVQPVPFETEMKRLLPMLSNVMMVGDKRRYNACIVTLVQKNTRNGELPGTDELDGMQLEVCTENLSRPVNTISEQRKSEELKKMIENTIKKINNDDSITFNNAWKVQKFRILPNDFSMETGEITPTLKLKRAEQDKTWKHVVDEMYDED